MAIYERPQRESAHVYSRVVDKSQVPSSLRWAAIGCVTASKGELNHIYQCGTTDYLASVFGEPSKDHISLICANKIIADDNTMFLIRVAHENSLRGAQAIVSTETNYNRPNQPKAIGELEAYPESEEGVKDLIQLKEEDLPNANLKNISSMLTFLLDNESDVISLTNKRIPATYRDVYQVDAKGNRTYSNELCLLLSDVLDQDHEVEVSLSDGGTVVEPSKYQSNWYYGEDFGLKSVIVLSPSAGVVENRNCDVSFSIKQVAKRQYGTATPNKIVIPVVLKSAKPSPSPEPGPEPEPEIPGVFWTSSFDVTDED